MPEQKRKIIYQEELTKEQKKPARNPASRETLKRILAGVFLAIVALFGFSVVLRSCADTAHTTGPAPRPSDQSAVTEAVAGVLDEHFPGHYSVTEDGEYIRICIWDDEFTALAVKAIEGSSYARGQWDGLMGDVSHLRDTIQELYSSRRVIINVCTDKSCEDVLYSVSTGGVIFDGVNQ